MNGQINQSIKCTVQQCKHHAAGQNYCSLREIQVGTHEPTQLSSSVPTASPLQ